MHATVPEAVKEGRRNVSQWIWDDFIKNGLASWLPWYLGPDKHQQACQLSLPITMTQGGRSFCLITMLPDCKLTLRPDLACLAKSCICKICPRLQLGNSL